MIALMLSAALSVTSPTSVEPAFSTSNAAKASSRPGPPSQDSQAVEALIARPESAEPMAYIAVVEHLWERGDRAQAAFWYYLWQMRTRPWARLGSPQTGQVRGAITQLWGPEINGWLGSDISSRNELVQRAITYEARLPLFDGRPTNVSEDQWLATVASERKTYAEQYAQILQTPEYNGERQTTLRRTNGLYVGPWQSPGAPLPEDWR